MKVYVNKLIGMVALIALAGIMNKKEGSVFGAVPKDAARLLGKKFARPVEKTDLPTEKGEKFEDRYNEVQVNTETHDVIEPMKSKEAAKASDGKELKALNDKLAALEAENAKLKEDLEQATKPNNQSGSGQQANQTNQAGSGAK